MSSESIQASASGARNGVAVAHPNIALIKYWGKSSDTGANEPAVSSLSITLDQLQTETSVTFSPQFGEDTLILNGRKDDAKLPRISRNLDKMRRIAGIDLRCVVETQNNFPTGAGLASSASGFAALVAAVNLALDMQLSMREQSMLARSMSGSAARSLFGGFVKIALADQLEGDTTFGRAYAEPFAASDHWPLEVCVGIVSEKEKAIGSTEGMERSRLSSPYYAPWLAGNDTDIVEAERSIMERDFDKLADLSEFSCLKMHAMALASRPGLIYWHGATVEAMHCIRRLRKEGVPVFFTIDAGPQIKAICAPGYGDTVRAALETVPGIQRVLRCGLGGDVRVSNQLNTGA